jgi:cell division protein FtsL
MNAAARAIHQNSFFSGHLVAMQLSKSMRLVLILLLAVLSSALAVVYTTNEQRLHISQLQQLEQHAHELQLQWGQLLLEQASLATSARVERLAVEKLNMHLPKADQTYLLQSP